MKFPVLILILLLITFGVVVIVYNLEGKPEQIACTEEAKLCSDGSAVGRTGPDCEFEKCPGEDGSKTYCKEEQRNADGCIEIYQPVCGWSNENIKCLKWPCASTYSNYCFACTNEDVEYYTSGECPKEISDSWKLDNIQLMQYETDVSFGCFGCSEPGEEPAICIDPIMEMKPVEETNERYCNSNFEVVEVSG